MLVRYDVESVSFLIARVEEDEEYKVVKTSIMFMKGMVALQEALLRIETLEAKVEELENK